MKRQTGVRQFVLDHVGERPKDIARLVAERFAITRQAANRHLARLVDEGVLEAKGQTRNRVYRLVVLGQVDRGLPVTPDLQEDVLWRENVQPLLSGALENVLDICNYGFTEMVNNVKDHSGSPSVTIQARVTAATVEMNVLDQGVGIFRKIKDALGLEDERHAILELAKGKLTTDPSRHTGEGIFFTSRMFDWFGIGSGRIALIHRREEEDFLIEDRAERRGTRVEMAIQTRSQHTAKEVFDRYATEQDDFAFRSTHVVVALAEAKGDKLISRSQAKRILSRLERFREVILDFKGIGSIGPAFADEIFRVFRSHSPSVRLIPVNTSEEVLRMVRRAEASRP